MLRHSGPPQLNFYGSCTPESFTHPVTLMRFQRGKATIENIKSFLQSIQPCTCQKKINACLLAEIFILTDIWRLAISEDLAACAAEKQRQLRIRAVWLNSSTSSVQIRMICWHDFCHDLRAEQREIGLRLGAPAGLRQRLRLHSDDRNPGRILKLKPEECARRTLRLR